MMPGMRKLEAEAEGVPQLRPESEAWVFGATGVGKIRSATLAALTVTPVDFRA